MPRRKDAVVDVRFISATNRDPQQAVDGGYEIRAGEETIVGKHVIVATGSAHKELGLDAGRYLAALDDADSIATALVEEPTHG